MIVPFVAALDGEMYGVGSAHQKKHLRTAFDDCEVNMIGRANDRISWSVNNYNHTYPKKNRPTYMETRVVYAMWLNGQHYYHK